jgi:hypothetical protein
MRAFCLYKSHLILKQNLFTLEFSRICFLFSFIVGSSVSVIILDFAYLRVHFFGGTPPTFDFASLVLCAKITGPRACVEREAQPRQQNTPAKPCYVAPTIVKGVVGVLLLWEAPLFRIISS